MRMEQVSAAAAVCRLLAVLLAWSVSVVSGYNSVSTNRLRDSFNVGDTVRWTATVGGLTQADNMEIVKKFPEGIVYQVAVNNILTSTYQTLSRYELIIQEMFGSTLIEVKITGVQPEDAGMFGLRFANGVIDYSNRLNVLVPVEEVDIQDMRTGQSVANQTVEILMDSYPAFRCVVRVNGSDVTPNVQVRFGRYDFINKMTKGDEIKTNTSANGLAIMNYSATWEVDRAYNATLDDHKKVLRCSAEMPNGNFGSVQSSATVDITFAPQVNCMDGVNNPVMNPRSNQSEIRLTCNVRARPMPTNSSAYWMVEETVDGKSTWRRIAYGLSESEEYRSLVNPLGADEVEAYLFLKDVEDLQSFPNYKLQATNNYGTSSDTMSIVQGTSTPSTTVAPEGRPNQATTLSHQGTCTIITSILFIYQLYAYLNSNH